jgi:alkanesulfonate monooxygenase SsuD/methylene tetrahydromethanopterin reductase-like flavin-dependent oxidoreductase (luciferase family)
MAWCLLGIFLERTKKIRVGPLVTTPIGGRYHPTLVAQACATLDQIYPGRLLLAVGAGEAINEYPFMKEWPPWKERVARLIEGVQLMRRLWESKSYFDFEGAYFGKKQLFLYTKPRTRIRIHMSAFGRRSAQLAGKYGDGLATTSARCPFETCRDVIFPNFEKGAREASKDPSKLEKIVSLAYTFESEKSFLATARQQAVGRLATGALDLVDPRKIENLSDHLSKEEILSRMHFCSRWSDLVELVSRYRKIGATSVGLSCGSDLRLLRAYAKHVSPHFKS